MSKDGLLTSINEYRNQLNQVESTIAACTDPNQIDSLENLKKDLTELLDLTKEQLTELDSGQSRYPFEDEMKLFLSEIGHVEKGEADDDDFQSKFETITLNSVEIERKKLGPVKLDEAIVRRQPVSLGETITQNGAININDDVKVEKTAVKLPIRVTNLVSQRQLPDTLHSKTNVILLIVSFMAGFAYLKQICFS